MPPLDVTLIHQPPLAPSSVRLNVMPMGLFSIADYLQKQGFTAEIIHTGLERIIDPSFSLEEYLRTRTPKLCCLSMHWHQSAAAVLQAAAVVRRTLPDTVIVLGGFTASCYPREILASMPEIDCIIEGEGEVPLKALAERARTGSYDWAGIPNAVWRQGDEIVRNDEHYALTAEFCPEFSFTNFSLLRHFDRYLTLRMNSDSPRLRKVFYFSPGRGCSVDCAFCGGSDTAFKRFFRRDALLLFDHQYVIAQLKSALEQGIDCWNCCFDPLPHSAYYPELFRCIRDAGLHLTLHFDCFGLPSSEFIRELQRTFASDSAINISPETGSETLRGRIKGFSYSNEALFAAIAAVQDIGVGVSVYFSSNHPESTPEDDAATEQLIASLTRTFPAAQIYCQHIEWEPGSVYYGEGLKGKLEGLPCA